MTNKYKLSLVLSISFLIFGGNLCAATAKIKAVHHGGGIKGAIATNNLILNPDFESSDADSNPLYWTGGKQISAGTKGGYCATWKTAKNKELGDFKSADVAVKPGEKYSLTYSFKSPFCLLYTFFLIKDSHGKIIKTAHIRQGESEKWRQGLFTIVMPPKAAKCQVMFRIWANGIGYLDQVKMTVVETPAIMLKLPRIAVYDNKTQITGLIKINPKKILIKQHKLLLKLYEADILLTSKEIENIPANNLSLNLNIKAVPVGNYNLEVCLLGKKANKIIANSKQAFYIIPQQKIPTSTPIKKVGVDAKNNITIDNKPFFPIGLYGVPGISHLKSARQQGFNTAIVAPNIPTLNDAADCNLKAIVYLYSGMTLDLERIKKDVITCRNHPALLAYYLFDEPPGHKITPKAIKVAYDLVKKLDPNHPVYIVNDKPATYGDYASDMLVLDRYPVWDGRPLTEISRCINLARKNIKNTKPIWFVAEAWHHLPEKVVTPQQEYALTYLSIVHQVNGIFYFTFYMDKWYMPDTDPALWSIFKKINYELNALAPILMEAQPVEQTASSSSNKLHLLLKKHNNHTYLIVVNPTAKPIDAQIKLPNLKREFVNLLFENRRIKPDAKGTFDDSFKPYEVHVYTDIQNFREKKISLNETIFNVSVAVPKKKVKKPLIKTPTPEEIRRWVRRCSGKTPHNPKDLALISKGATVRASSEHSESFPAMSAIDGDASSDNWAGGNGWNDKTAFKYPDWLEIILPKKEKISQVIVYTLKGGELRDYKVQGWDDKKWIDLDSVKDNTKSIITHKFAARQVKKVRILITKTNGAKAAKNGYSRIIEVEVLAPGE